MTSEDRAIQRDRMRFIKNSQAANLAILGIVFNALYFINLYQSDVGTYYYTILIGASILYNLIFMLITFLASEGVKNYQNSYSYVLIALGVVQVARVFIMPMQARGATTLVNGEEVAVMGGGQFTYLVAMLGLSAACLLASAAINLIKCRELNEHLKSLGIQNA